MDFSSPNFNALIEQGYNSARETKRQEGLDNALATYSQTPDDPAAVAGIARYDPRTAIQIGQMQQRREADARTLQDKKLAEGHKAVGQAALLVSQLPPEQQAQAWDQQIDELVGMGWDGLSQYRGKYSPQALQAVIAQSGLAGEYMTAQRPSYMAPQPGAPLVNVRDPAALNAYNQSVLGGQAGAPAGPVKLAGQADREALPPGATYIAPDGSVRRKGGNR